MNFTLTPWLLMPVGITIFAVYVLMNREKVVRKNKQQEERMRVPKFFRSSRRDPDGKMYAVAAVGMIIIAIFQFFAFGTGLIET